MDKLFNWFKTRGPFLATVILLIAVPLYPKFPWRLIDQTWVAIRFSDFLVAGAVIIWAGSQALRRFPIFKSRVFQLFILFWTAGLVSTLSAWLITDLLNPSLMILHWARRIQYMIIFFIAYDAVDNYQDWKDLISALLLTLLGVFVYAIGQRYFSWPVISTMNQEFSKGTLLYLDKWTRVSASFAGHYDLAVWLLMVLTLIPSILISLKKRALKFLLFIPAGLAFYLLVLTASRVSFVAYLIGISTVLFLAKKYFWIGPVVIVSLLFGFSSQELNQRLGINFRSVARIDQQISKVEDFWDENNPVKFIALRQKQIPIEQPEKTEIDEEGEPTEEEELVEEPDVAKPSKEKEDKELKTSDWPTPEEAAAAAERSSSIRFNIEWPRAKKAFLKNPLTGLGYSSLGLATDNSYLRMLGEIGLIGTAAFFLVIFHLASHFWQSLFHSKQRRIWAAGFLGIMIGVLANGIFIDVFEASKIAYSFWLLMGIGYKLVNSK